jgi:signal transduction histidine kinase/CheY-like chemotaxis protein
MGRKASSGVASWHEIAKLRARDVRVRMAFSIMVAVTGQFLERGSAWPGVWLTATALTQLLSLMTTEPMRRDPTFVVSRRRETTIFVSVAVSAWVFASCGVMFWGHDGWGGRLFAVIIMAGAALNVALQAGPSARLLWTGCAPFMILLQALPLVSFLSASGPERGVMGMTAFAATLFIAHLVAAGRRGLASSRTVEAALQDANRERLRAEAASQAKSDFLGVMSHELRTPLNGVLGMAQAIGRGPLTAEQRSRLEVLRNSGETLLLLLNDVLDISQIETAQLALECEAFDVAALAAQAQAVFGPPAAAKGLDFRLDLRESPGATRTGDLARVRQVLHRLVGNALKFTETGGVSVVISGAGDELVFEITDTGPGMAPERMCTLFESFDQSDASTSRRHSGCGLGLGVARGLARLMGGDVTVRSAQGQGSVFTARMWLPQTVAAQADEPQAMAAQDWPAPEDARIRVLAAEDNPTNQLVLKTLLGQLGIAVHIVADGQEAVAAWSAAPWDVVLMDIRMPGMDGFAATRAIRAAELAQGRPRTPIIAVTADATSQQAADYMAAGMDGLAPKPIQLAQLAKVLDAVLVCAPAEPERATEARSRSGGG